MSEKFEKISKEEWIKLSKEEQDYFTLQFNKSIELRRKKTIFITRGIALLCVLGLFFIGIVQIVTYNDNQKVMEKYGTNGYCYLCGEYSLKKCDCSYFSAGFIPQDMKNYTNQLAEYNSNQCDSGNIVRNNPLMGDNFIPGKLNLS